MDNNNKISNLDSSEVRTVIGSYGLAIKHALEASGHNAEDLYSRAKIYREPSCEPSDRLTADEVISLLETGAMITKDPSFGLTVARFAHPSTLHALGYAVLASTTLRDCCERLVRYFRVASEQGEMRFHEDEQYYYLSSYSLSHRISPESIDTWHAFIIRMFRVLYKPDFAPVYVKLERPIPEGYESKYNESFNAPVTFNSDHTEICIEKSYMDERLVGANREIAHQFDQIVESYLVNLDKSDICRQVRVLMVEGLPSGQCNKNTIASELGMSSSKLQQKLAARGTSFQEVLDETRYSLAQAYLGKKEVSVTEIAFLLGFSDTSSFSRVFKRWHGTSPKQYRDALKG